MQKRANVISSYDINNVIIEEKDKHVKADFVFMVIYIRLRKPFEKTSRPLNLMS